MSRPLTPAEAAAALRRGQSVEQFVSLANGRVLYLSASPAGGHFEVRRHHVRDEGTDNFRDLSEFSPVDDDEFRGEGVVVHVADDPDDAVRAAGAHDGGADRWVNHGTAADDYRRAKGRG